MSWAMFKISFKTGIKENLKKEGCLFQTRLDLIHFQTLSVWPR